VKWLKPPASASSPTATASPAIPPATALSIVTTAAAQNGEDALAKKVDQLFATWDKPESPGAAVAIIVLLRILSVRLGIGIPAPQWLPPVCLTDPGREGRHFGPKRCRYRAGVQARERRGDAKTHFVPGAPVDP